MRYIEGIKYVLAEDYSVQTPVIGEHVDSKWFTLTPDGRLTVREGFAWDGASGPTIDTPASMVPSLVHDVFCICMRDGRLSYARWQPTVNAFFYSQLRAAGMPAWRARIWHAGVVLGDAGNPKQGPDRVVLTAP